MLYACSEGNPTAYAQLLQMEVCDFYDLVEARRRHVKAMGGK